MNKHLLLVLVGTAVGMAGCTMAPKYARPAAPVPPQWPSGPAYAPAATNAPLAPDIAWQEFFTDGKLRELIGLALTNNRDLRVATLNVERARALYGIQRAELIPALEGSAAYSKQRLPPGVTGFNQPLTIESYGANLGVAAWEIDFFGRIRSLAERALQEYLGSEQARRSAQILLVSSVAQAYLAVAADRENLHLSEITLQTQQVAYDLVKRRYELGLAPELDVFRAQTPLDVARRDVAIYTQQVAKDENALTLLVGAPSPPDWSGLPAELSGVTPPREISAGISSEVLLRRPDVLEAEHQLKAVNANIGAARAAFFPRISLTGAIGTGSTALSDLFAPGSQAWNYGAQLVMPIFDARTWAGLKATKVEKDIAIAQYEKAIQAAFRDVADALAASGTVDRQLAAQESLVHASAETYRLAQSRYERGIDNFLSVLDAQRSLFAAQQVLVLLRLQKLATQVNLYAVLGGGWEENNLGNAQHNHAQRSLTTGCPGDPSPRQPVATPTGRIPARFPSPAPA